MANAAARIVVVCFTVTGWRGRRGGGLGAVECVADHHAAVRVRGGQDTERHLADGR